MLNMVGNRRIRAAEEEIAPVQEVMSPSGIALPLGYDAVSAERELTAIWKQAADATASYECMEEINCPATYVRGDGCGCGTCKDGCEDCGKCHVCDGCEGLVEGYGMCMQTGARGLLCLPILILCLPLMLVYRCKLGGVNLERYACVLETLAQREALFIQGYFSSNPSRESYQLYKQLVTRHSTFEIKDSSSLLPLAAESDRKAIFDIMCLARRKTVGTSSDDTAELHKLIVSLHLEDPLGIVKIHALLDAGADPKEMRAGDASFTVAQLEEAELEEGADEEKGDDFSPESGLASFNALEVAAIFKRVKCKAALLEHYPGLGEETKAQRRAEAEEKRKKIKALKAHEAKLKLLAETEASGRWTEEMLTFKLTFLSPGSIGSLLDGMVFAKTDECFNALEEVALSFKNQQFFLYWGQLNAKQAIGRSDVIKQSYYESALEIFKKGLKISRESPMAREISGQIESVGKKLRALTADAAATPAQLSGSQVFFRGVQAGAGRELGAQTVRQAIGFARALI